jgi:hypothetical protein
MAFSDPGTGRIIEQGEGLVKIALAEACKAGDVLGIKQELGENSDKLTVELRNDDGQYTSPGQGDIAVLDTGCQLDFSPGYLTAAGNEASTGLSYCLEGYEHTSDGGKASLIIHARDGWQALGAWRARYQFRWNKSSDDMSVKDILALVLARVGLKLEVKSQSSVITGFYPDFTISPHEAGRAVIQKLLSLVPDVLFIEGGKAYLVNPQSSDNSAYSYGGEHQVWEGRYVQAAWAVNRVQVEGYDTGSGDPIIVESFGWDEIARMYDRIRQINDRNINTVAEAGDRGAACLRKSGIASLSGSILVPVNCGQQLYDVVDINDVRAGLAGSKRRVLGVTLVYTPHRGEYYQRLWLGAA